MTCPVLLQQPVFYHDKGVKVASNPLVSIIVPAYNAQDYIQATLESILSQSYENIEVIVVDDGSTDQTAQVVKSYGCRVLYFYQNNSGGASGPRNTGIAKSSGEFLCFIDADDLITPNRIAIQVDFMQRHPDVGLVFCNYRNFCEDGPSPVSHFETCPKLWAELKDLSEIVLGNACGILVDENFGISGSIMVRKSVLALEVGFEPSLKACEDFHFYFRIARHGPVGIINEVGMLRRMHGNNMTCNGFKMLTEGIRSRTMLRDSEQDSRTRMLLSQYLSERHGDFARYYADRGEYVRAFQKDIQALSYHFSWSRLRASSRNIMRTVLMSAGLLGRD